MQSTRRAGSRQMTPDTFSRPLLGDMPHQSNGLLLGELTLRRQDEVAGRLAARIEDHLIVVGDAIAVRTRLMPVDQHTGLDDSGERRCVLGPKITPPHQAKHGAVRYEIVERQRARKTFTS